jgi:hypothetical protein
MKKIISFFSFLLILFLISACNWQIPSKIQLKGSPSLKFALDMDFSEMFREMMGDAFNSNNEAIAIQDCTNNAIQDMTFLIRVGLVDEAIDINSIFGTLPPGNPTVPLSTDTKLFSNRVELPLSSLGNFLEGFKFNTTGIKSSLFIDGSDIVEHIKLDLKFTDSQGQIHPVINNDIIPRGASGVNPTGKAYDKNVIPPGGRSIDTLARQFVGAKEDLTIDLDVILSAGAYSASLLNNSRVAIELVFWLPLVFEPVPPKAEFILPGFEGMGEFLKSLSESGMIESLKLQIGLNRNPFKDGDFIIRDAHDGYEIECPMSETLIGFEIKKNDIKHINDNKNTFKPEFKILFDGKDTLRIPRTLKLMSVSLGAEINHTIDFLGSN